MSRLLSLEDVAMNAEELAKFQQLLAAYDQALRLQRMRERTIETYRQYLWKAANHFNRCPDDLSADELKNYFAWMLRAGPLHHQLRHKITLPHLPACRL